MSNHSQNLIPAGTEVLLQYHHGNEGALGYSLQRFRRPQIWELEDSAQFSYQVNETPTEKGKIELKFCISGNTYCRQNGSKCASCRKDDMSCENREETLDIFRFVFSSSLLKGVVPSAKGQTLSEDLLAFRFADSFSRTLSICSRSRQVLDHLISCSLEGGLQHLFFQAQAQMLLLFSLDCMDDKQVDVIACKFLANEPDRDKILEARDILIRHIGEPITIKQLSRKVAMNECYLKKGFKEMFGMTIFEFYQNERMSHARHLLYDQGLTVTEVSIQLGYSSISHFSTAFKKHTGLKPCELLLR